MGSQAPLSESRLVTSGVPVAFAHEPRLRAKQFVGFAVGSHEPVGMSLGNVLKTDTGQVPHGSKSRSRAPTHQGERSIHRGERAYLDTRTPRSATPYPPS